MEVKYFYFHEIAVPWWPKQQGSPLRDLAGLDPLKCMVSCPYMKNPCIHNPFYRWNYVTNLFLFLGLAQYKRNVTTCMGSSRNCDSKKATFALIPPFLLYHIWMVIAIPIVVWFKIPATAVTFHVCHLKFQVLCIIKLSMLSGGATWVAAWFFRVFLSRCSVGASKMGCILFS